MEPVLTTFFPKDVTNIIKDYVFQLEHAAKWRCVCFELQEMHWIRRRVRLNIEFRSVFYPGFFQDLWYQHLPTVPEQQSNQSNQTLLLL